MSEHSSKSDVADDSCEEAIDDDNDNDEQYDEFSECEDYDYMMEYKDDENINSSCIANEITTNSNTYPEEVYEFMNWVFYTNDLNSIHNTNSQVFYDTLKHFYRLPENESHDKQLDIKMLDNRLSPQPSDNFVLEEIKHLNLLYRRYGRKESDRINRIFGLFANAHTIDELKCRIELLSDTTDDYKIIHRYVTNSGENYFVKHIFKIERITEKQSFKQFESCKRMLLFHGTPIYNCYGILKNGLKTVRNGIFFADMPQKSYNYSQKFNGYFSGKCYDFVILFVADVAVGNLNGTGLPEGSCFKYKGKLVRDSSDVTTIDNAIVPYGESKSDVMPNNDVYQSRYQYNEYMVTKPEQVQLKYLIVFRNSSHASCDAHI